MLSRCRLFTCWLIVASVLFQNVSASNTHGPPLRATNHRERGPLFNVTAALLYPEACKFLNAKECEDIFQERVVDTRHHLLSPHQQARNLQIQHNPRLGKIKVLVLMVQFKNHKNRNLVEKSVIEDIWNGPIKDWFKVNARGRYEIEEAVVIDWTLTDNTEAHYADGKSGFTPGVKKAMYPILDKLDSEGFDWGPFDVDQDGRLDSVVMMHSGISGVAGEEDCHGGLVKDRIWPHAFASSLRSSAWQSQDGTVMLNGYTVNSVFDGLCDDPDEPMTPGLTVHEYMHTMNLIDLYDGANLFEAKGVGIWDIMGHPYGADNSGTPGLLGAWMKEEVGWLDPINIAENGDYVCRAAHDQLEAYRIDISTPSHFAPEYLLIENRQPIGFEANIRGAGLLIWHIDDLADEMLNRGYPGQGGWPENGNHYQVAVLQKDGNYDLERNRNFGDPEDLWVVGDILGPGMGGENYPNTDSYQNGVIVENGISIEVISEDGTDITFRVTGLKQSTSPQTPEPPAPTVSSESTNPQTPEPPAPTVSPGAATSSEDTPVNPSTEASPKPSTSDPNAPTSSPRWILSRPPGPTRAPFVLPEFPQKSLKQIADEGSSASHTVSQWNGSIAMAVLSVLLGLYV